MTQKGKQVLLKDLSARLSYGVKVNIKNYYTSSMEDEVLDAYHLTCISYNIEERKLRPYLRPMSSMTEKEKKVFDDFCVVDEFAWNGNAEKGYPNQATIMSDGIDWLNAHYFDYRGLIEKGLALEAPNDMYKED